MILVFTSIIALRNYVYVPGYTIPYSVDQQMRSFCRGFWCDYHKDPNPNQEKLKEIINSFRNSSTNHAIHNKIANLSNLGYHPAKCASGFFYLIGLSDYPQDFNRSYELLLDGYANNSWSCAEILAFHPMTENRTEYIRKAADTGSVLAKLALIRAEVKKPNPNYESIFFEAYTLAHLGVTSWIKKHRPGPEFGHLIQQIHREPKSQVSAWKALAHMGQSGHQSAAVWVAEGVMSNRTNVMTKEQAAKMLVPFVEVGPWSLDHLDITSSVNKYNKSTILEFFSNAGDLLAQSLYSYPTIYPQLFA